MNSKRDLFLRPSKAKLSKYASLSAMNARMLKTFRGKDVLGQ